MYLLDTNVVSELRKAAAGKADRNVIAWARGVSVGSAGGSLPALPLTPAASRSPASSRPCTR